MHFPTNYQSILERIQQINPVAYAKTRNYVTGAATQLSPYISRGVISLPMIKEAILKKYKRYESEKLLQELAWREYWQNVWEAKGDEIFTDLKHPQPDVLTHEMPAAIQHAATGIDAIDESIQHLYETGYMHNHCRMYVASVACNIAKTHWRMPARWMYYHLLDGDLASNSLSWQWVAGSFSSKKYYCNQENINTYCNSRQQHSFLDQPYEVLPSLEIPDAFIKTMPLQLTTHLPETTPPLIDTGLPTLLYNAYNMDPLWHADEKANRILLLEPAHYTQYPVSEKVISFIIALGENIPGLQVFTGSFEALQNYTGKSSIHFKKHPAFTHYKGEAALPERLFPQVSGYFPSFFAYWKKCERYLTN
jgi:deoxyribodipyrimidine photo-lyase